MDSQAIGSYRAGPIDSEELDHIEHRALPGSGSSGTIIEDFVHVCTRGMFTANTMSSAVEALSMAPPGNMYIRYS